MSRSIRLYTKQDAENIAQMHVKLHGISEICIYGELLHALESRRVQLLLVADNEALFDVFVKHLKLHRLLYQNEMTENECKFAVAQMLWGEYWPQWHVYKQSVDTTEDIDITVVPLNWQDRLDELHNLFVFENLVPQLTYSVA